ncbi:MAG: type II secretion system F family protein [Acidobacteriota bacterium]
MVLMVVFLAAFASVALVLLAVTSGRAQEKKRTRTRFEKIAVRTAAVDVEPAPSVVREEEVFSSIPWLDRLLGKADISERIRLLLYQADLSWTVSKLLLASMLLAFLGGILVNWRIHALVLAFFLALVCGSSLFLYVFQKRNRRFDQIRLLLPDALDLMVAAIRAGESLMSAMGQAAKESPDPLRREMRQCFEEQNYGLDLRTAMANLAYRVPTPDTRMIATAVLIQRDTGGNLTEILEKVATLIRQEFRLQRQVRVHTAQGRMTGWILSLLPVILGVLMYLVNPELMSLLWTRPLGLKMLYGAIAMECLGAVIIRKIIRIRI